MLFSCTETVLSKTKLKISTQMLIQTRRHILLTFCQIAFFTACAASFFLWLTVQPFSLPLVYRKWICFLCHSIFLFLALTHYIFIKSLYNTLLAFLICFIYFKNQKLSLHITDAESIVMEKQSLICQLK